MKNTETALTLFTVRLVADEFVRDVGKDLKVTALRSLILNDQDISQDLANLVQPSIP